MKKLFIYTLILGQMFAGIATAEDLSSSDTDTLIAQCRQEAIDAGSSNVDAYISDCLDKIMQYEQGE